MQNQPISQSDTAKDRELTTLELDILAQIESIVAPDACQTAAGPSAPALAPQFRELVQQRLEAEVIDAAVNGRTAKRNRSINVWRAGAGREAYNDARRTTRFIERFEETGQLPRAYEKATPERRKDQKAASKQRALAALAALTPAERQARTKAESAARQLRRLRLKQREQAELLDRAIV